MTESEPMISQTERLDKIYYCSKCDMVFLFESDIAEHSSLFGGHDDFEIAPLE